MQAATWLRSLADKLEADARRQNLMRQDMLRPERQDKSSQLIHKLLWLKPLEVGILAKQWASYAGSGVMVLRMNFM